MRRPPARYHLLALPLLLLALLAPGLTPRALAGTAGTTTVTTFTPAADALVRQASPATNYGTWTMLEADGGSDWKVESNLRFAVAALPGALQRATLRLYAFNGTNDGPQVYRTTDSWDERTITWGTSPGRVGGPLADVGAIPTNRWVEYDVTAAVRGVGTYSFVLVPQSADEAQFRSRESGTPPQLVLTTAPATVMPTATMVATATPPPTATATPTATVVPTATATPTKAATATATALAPSATVVPPATATATVLPTPTKAATGTTYYVDSAGGSDGNSGMSAGTAWRSLTKANAAPLAPGDRLLFARGGSWAGGLVVARSGVAGNPIVVGAYGAGAAPRFTGASSCVKLTGWRIVLREVRVDGCSWAGVDIAGGDNRVEDSAMAANVVGVHIRAGAVRNAVVRSALVDNNRMNVLTAGGDDDSGAFGVLLQGDDNEVAYNTISGCDAFSYDYGRDGAAVEVYGGRGNHIHHNTAVDNATFAELGDGRAADNTFAYNVVRAALPTATFLVTRGAGSGWGPVARTRLYNNTVHLTGAASQGFVCDGGCDGGILTLRNNVIQAVAKVGYADGRIDEDYNLYWGGRAQFAQGAHSRVADPQFVAPGAGDLAPRPTSPLIDAGVPLGYTADRDGRAVAQDGDGDGVARPDIGALEYAR